jgi:hypothetical protein
MIVSTMMDHFTVRIIKHTYIYIFIYLFITLYIIPMDEPLMSRRLIMTFYHVPTSSTRWMVPW